MKIGIYGGSFDPFTIAHRAIVEHVLKNKLVDRVVIAPTIVSWHRPNKDPWLSDAERLSAIWELLKPGDLCDNVDVYEGDYKLRAICKDNPALEERYLERHRFIDTLVDLKIKYGKNNEYFVIMGNDSWDKFDTWSCWKEIAGLVTKILVANGRNGAPQFTAKHGIDNVDWFSIGSEFRDVSASKIREQYDDLNAYLEATTASLKEQCTSEEILLKTPIFAVSRGKETKTGLKPFLINAPDWVSIVVKDKSGKLLVVKQLRYGSNCQIEEFPCGMVEKDETPQEAVVRELAEETGLKLLARRKGKYLGLSYLGATNPNPAFMTNKMHYFFLDLRAADFERVEQKLDEHERITYEWMDAKEFYDKSMKLAKSGDAKIPAILLSAFALLSLKDTPEDEDIDDLVKIHEEEEKKEIEAGNVEVIEASITKDYLDSHDLGPDEYDLQYRQMVDDANDCQET